MTDPSVSNTKIYEIRIKGHLESRWVKWFDGLTVTPDDGGDTLVTGPVADQAALHGLLKKVRDLGLPLVSVNRVQLQETHPNHFEEGESMKVNAITTERMDTKALLSTLWIVVMINMLKADILSLYIPGWSEELAKTAGDTPIPEIMLGAAVMMEVSILMIILSRILKHRANRRANIVVGIITIVFIVGGGASYPHYLFIAAVEVICLMLIIWIAWKWRSPEE